MAVTTGQRYYAACEKKFDAQKWSATNIKLGEVIYDSRSLALNNYDMRKFYFTNTVVDRWNSLPNWVVTANST